MKTKQLKEKHPLALAVLSQLGGIDKETIAQAIDAARNGADAGWCGFTYYKDTLAFTKAHRRAIADSVAQMADELGETPISLVRGFHCIKGQVGEQAAAIALYGGRAPRALQDEVLLAENALAWFALEEVGRALDPQN